jgi:hypothetical protein
MLASRIRSSYHCATGSSRELRIRKDARNI